MRHSDPEDIESLAETQMAGKIGLKTKECQAENSFKDFEGWFVLFVSDDM
jgi:hypothetical protein